MVKPSPEPLVMSRADHIDHIISYWRQREADMLTGDVLFDDQLRAVAAAMAEPEPPSVNKTALAIHGGYFAFIAFGGLLLWEMMRP